MPDVCHRPICCRIESSNGSGDGQGRKSTGVCERSQCTSAGDTPNAFADARTLSVDAPAGPQSRLARQRDLTASTDRTRKREPVAGEPMPVVEAQASLLRTRRCAQARAPPSATCEARINVVAMMTLSDSSRANLPISIGSRWNRWPANAIS